jgi:hypothetical protein
MTKLAIGTLIIPFALAAAQPVGVPNFRQVSERIYRGAQPTTEGFEQLAKMGIKTVVDLRREPEQFQAEQRMVEALGMKFLSVPMSMQAPTEEQVSRVMPRRPRPYGYRHCLLSQSA